MGIQCEICGRFIGYQEFEDGKTTMVTVPEKDGYWEPPAHVPAHQSCVDKEVKRYGRRN